MVFWNLSFFFDEATNVAKSPAMDPNNIESRLRNKMVLRIVKENLQNTIDLLTFHISPHV